MNAAQLDDGRVVLIDPTRNQTRRVTIDKIIRHKDGTVENVNSTEDFFLGQGYVNVWLGGAWQAVREARLKKLEYGSPFSVL